VKLLANETWLMLAILTTPPVLIGCSRSESSNADVDFSQAVSAEEVPAAVETAAEPVAALPAAEQTPPAGENRTAMNRKLAETLLQMFSVWDQPESPVTNP
jgi:ketosteroid isomerase-like protein